MDITRYSEQRFAITCPKCAGRAEAVADAKHIDVYCQEGCAWFTLPKGQFPEIVEDMSLSAEFLGMVTWPVAEEVSHG